jgi:intraflagellar transport protein 56
VHKLSGGNAALQVLQTNVFRGGNSSSIIRHNLAVFSGGARALQTFSSLAEQNDEAKLNLALCYIKCGDIDSAAELLEGVDAKSLHSHNVLAILKTEVAQRNGDEHALEEAKRYFNSVGNSKAGDTVCGRHCTASYLFLTKQFDEVIQHLESIRNYSRKNLSER